jgi:hypothetical protein
VRTILSLFGVIAAGLVFLVAPAWAVSGGAYTTVNPEVDGPNHCKNGNPGVNCNIYDGKEFVWLNGGPAANGLGPDGEYFFAVLAPGGQPDPNDGGPKNLSDDFDAVANRTFTVTNGEVSAYAGTHTFTPPLIRLFPYADTPNPGGVYIMAICSLARGYPVEPRDCKYDAFKVQRVGQGKIQHVLSGKKYEDLNRNGQLDPGEPGLAGWTITISCSNGVSASVTTDASGEFSFTTPATQPSSGTTTCTVQEVQQAGWTQTGNTVDQTTTMGGATVVLAGFVYTVTLPNDRVSAVAGLNFGNVRGDKPPVCPDPTYGVTPDGRNYLTITVQDADTGLADITVTFSSNTTVDIPPYYGSTDVITITATQQETYWGWGLEFVATDLAGNSVVCDPAAGVVVRETGASEPLVLTGIAEYETTLTLVNGETGVRNAEIAVNGAVFRMTGLAGGETRTIDIASALVPGRANVIVVTAHGRPGATATVIVHD